MRRPIWPLICAVVLILLLATSPLPHRRLVYADSNADKLIEQEKYAEAIEYLKLVAADDSRPTEWLSAYMAICHTYGLWGKGGEALVYCQGILNHKDLRPFAECLPYVVRNQLESKPQCPRGVLESFGYLSIINVKYLEAVAYYRLGELPKALSLLSMPLQVDPKEWKYLTLAAIVKDAMGISSVPLSETLDSIRTSVPEKELARFNRERAALLTARPTDPPAIPEATDASYNWLIFLPFFALGIIGAGVAVYLSRHKLRWVGPDLQTEPGITNPTPPTAMPMYYDIRYPNQSYRIAAYCFAAFWIVLAAPLVLALIVPAWILLLDFSTTGFRNAYGTSAGILRASLSWGRLWFALLLLSLMGFTVFKLYGRFSLPKRMRPRIRLVYGTIRFAVFGAILASVGTFLSYFGTAFAGIYANPFVRMLIDLLRKAFGF